MRETRLMMGMPITVDVLGDDAGRACEAAFQYFASVDARFSPYKTDSELSAFARGDVPFSAISTELSEVLGLCELTRSETDGYFDIRRPDGRIDPSGLVKGWAIRNSARRIAALGHHDYFVDAGGDIECHGHNAAGEPWRVGIRNPFNDAEIVKVLRPGDAGVATSGAYVRGRHIYDPHAAAAASEDIASVTVIGPDVYEADRFATAAFAMGREGARFLEMQPGLEAYVIDRSGVPTMTSGFSRFVSP
jgi:thiamine biosynthesis lipoprotein